MGYITKSNIGRDSYILFATYRVCTSIKHAPNHPVLEQWLWYHPVYSNLNENGSYLGTI